MSIKLMTRAWSTPRLSATETLVLLALADHANDDGECWPSQGGLANRARATDRTVRNALAGLRTKGLVTWESRTDGVGRVVGCRYHISFGPETVSGAPEASFHGPGSQLPVSRARQALSSESSVEPTNESRDKPRKKVEYSEDFDGFWLDYPRKTAKEAAWRAWKKVSPDDVMMGLMARKLAWQKGHAWKGKEMKYVPYPATWINGRRWEDETE